MPRAPHLPVTRDARLGRRLLAEQQVLSPPLQRAIQFQRHPRVAPEHPSSPARRAFRAVILREAGMARPVRCNGLFESVIHAVPFSGLGWRGIVRHHEGSPSFTLGRNRPQRHRRPMTAENRLPTVRADRQQLTSSARGDAGPDVRFRIPNHPAVIDFLLDQDRPSRQHVETRVPQDGTQLP